MKFIILFNFTLLCSLVLSAQPLGCNNPAAGLTCEEAPIICDISVLNGYCTTLPDFNNPTGPSPLCIGVGVPNNTIWFGFIAGSSFMSLTLTPSNCNGSQPGIQGGIYTGDCGNLSAVVCQGVCFNSPINLSSADFTPGQEYWFIIDGCNSSVCDITVTVEAGNTMAVLGDIGPISGPKKLCPGSTKNYSVPPVTGADYYYWTLDGVLIDDPLTVDNLISLNINSPGVHKLCLDVANFCLDVGQPPLAKCIDITVVDGTDVIDPAPAKICANDTYLYHGIEYTPGQYTVKLTSSLGCDSIVTLTVEGIPFAFKDLGKVYKCAGECLTIKDNLGNGGVYCEEAENKTISLKNWQGCDSLVKYSLRFLEVQTKINPPESLNCLYTQVTLNASSSIIKNSVVNTYTWTDVGGNILGDTAAITVTQAGTYCLSIIGEAPNGVKCGDTTCVTVIEDHTKPDISTSIIDTMLSCIKDTLCIYGISTDSTTRFHWFGPDSLLVNNAQLCIAKPGAYTVIGIAANFCRDTVSFNISTNYNHKAVLSKDSVVCYKDTILLNNQPLTAPADYTYNEQSNDTCFTYHYHLKLKNIVDTTFHLCKADIIYIKDTLIDKAGVYFIPFHTTSGCDSIYNALVVEDPIDTTNLDLTVVKGYHYHGILVKKDTIISIIFLNKYGCDSTVIANIHILTSTENPQKDIGIFVVPNPAKNQIKILSKEAIEYESYEIYNSIGQLMKFRYQKASLPLELDITNWPATMYLIKLKTKAGIIVTSFIKQE